MNSQVKLPPLSSINWIIVDWEEVKPKCECGCEKAKVPGHSTWCPKYEELKL